MEHIQRINPKQQNLQKSRHSQNVIDLGPLFMSKKASNVQSNSMELGIVGNNSSSLVLNPVSNIIDMFTRKLVGVIDKFRDNKRAEQAAKAFAAADKAFDEARIYKASDNNPTEIIRKSDIIAYETALKRKRESTSRITALTGSVNGNIQEVLDLEL